MDNIFDLNKNIDDLWGKDSENILEVITEKDVLAICEKDINNKQDNDMGLEYKVVYMPMVVGVDRYGRIQDVSTVLVGKILNKEYIQGVDEDGEEL